MFELNGKFASCKVFTDVIDQNAISQLIGLLNQPAAEGQKIRIMPDVHAGKGCTIGTTMTITNKIVPNLVGVDIGCGMETVKLKEKHIEPAKLDKVIREKVPSGFEVRKSVHSYAKEIDLLKLRCFDHIYFDRAELSLGTLGGGNHFIEADKDTDGNIYIVIHSGSRHLGVEVAKFYQEEAYKQLKDDERNQLNLLISSLHAQGKERDINSEIEKFKSKKITVPKEFAYCEGGLFDNYLHDMKIVQQFAMLNRKAMMREIIKNMGLHIDEQFTTIHNYIDTENMILRKGAVSAQKDEILIIPINMRDGSLICRGKGNDDWNRSAPHGAGRIMSRSQAKENFTVSEFKKQMSGIYTTSVNSGTLDECPMAYKSFNDIADNIGETVEIVKVIKPIYNFKASEK